MVDAFGFGSAIGSFIGNQVTSAINSSRAWKYTQRAMNYQDTLNRNFTKDQYGLMREGLAKANYNPLLALGSSPTTPSSIGGAINSDSDNGSQAITSAIDSMTGLANAKNIQANTKKIDEETKGVELENRLKQRELNTSPKAVISDLIEGNDTPVTRVLKKVGSKLGISTGEINSAVTSEKNSVRPIIKLYDKPYVQKGVPKSVVKKFNSMGSSSAQSSSRKFDYLDDINKKYAGFTISRKDFNSRKIRNNTHSYSHRVSLPSRLPSGF